ncbi:pectinesterase inhibitor 5-like [Gossypium arboreum]|uniref:Pectinesterase inhibitor domain-containing protein n=1 Tax=Gossypium arboreum TaxID=29729 RepID=A0ABR0PC25_GOSAR|nr:pectinesterase inhibitor 5-like [Gossypium arboreum]KAK5818793.1 hypothetical protein PVK06_023738 [Gossypium arboreum]
MGNLNSLCSVATILVAIAYFCFNGVVVADVALIKSICKQSQDYDFCMTSLGTDPRSETTDVRGLAMVSASLAVIQIQDTLGRIPDIIKQTTDPVAVRRLGVCENDYDGLLGNFQNAFRATSNNAFQDTVKFVRDGEKQVADCHNIFRKDGPIATSPIEGDDVKVFKLAELVLIAIYRLIPKI